MNTLPLDCLVANLLACECRLDLPQDEGDIYSVPIDDIHWMGVTVSESGRKLLFFAHPGPEVFEDAQLDGNQPSDEKELDLGDDVDGNWVLTTNRSNGRHTLWISAMHEQVGHVEFARIVNNLRWRFAVWDEVLDEDNDLQSGVTQETSVSQLQQRKVPPSL